MRDPLWTVSDLANYLGKPVSWVYDNHIRESIPSYRIGQHLRFSPAEVYAWIERECRGPA